MTEATPIARTGRSENDLIARLCRGDTEAFELLVEQQGPYIFNLALRLVNDPAEAEDISQEVFIRVWKSIRSFRGEAAFKTWLYRIVTNVCFNRLPQLKRQLAAMDPTDPALALPAPNPAVEQLVERQELAERLAAGLAALPEGYRYLLTLRHVQEMSYDEIAAVMEMPLGTVKTGIFRARRLLKATLLQQIGG